MIKKIENVKLIKLFLNIKLYFQVRKHNDGNRKQDC